MTDPRRAIPSVEKILAAPELQSILRREPRARVIAIVRAVQESVRGNGAAAHDIAWYAEQVAEHLSKIHRAQLRPVINATGVVLHTNLGRAPLSEAALQAIAEASQGYSNLEYELASGTRGSRYHHCEQLLRELTGAEAALVVNNNAAALILALNTFAVGKKVVISRGELVEIGGSFRIPEILVRSGAELREVGATNRTHLRDYRAAIAPDVGALLKVHRSNFQMSGYISEVEAGELDALARAAAIPFIHDLGSGLLEDLSDVGLTGEPTAPQAVAAAPGAVITMSGDKLLGGPQAGILLGSAEQITRMRENALCRALRVDKLTIAALSATLRAYGAGSARTEIATLRMLTLPAAVIERRAQRLSEELRAAGVPATVVAADSAVGGGAYPGHALPTHVVLLHTRVKATELDQRLRAGTPPIVTRIVDDRVALDLRTVTESDESVLAEVVINAARA